MNGFLYPEVTLLEEKVRSISGLLIDVEERSARMPDREVSERRSLISSRWPTVAVRRLGCSEALQTITIPRPPQCV